MKFFPMLTLLMAVLTLFSGCTSITTRDLSKAKKRIVMSKGPCFGSCPVYTLTVYEGGLVSYEGERFTERMGTHVKQLDAADYRTLIKAFEEVDMWSFQNTYKAQIPDLPTVTITYYRADGYSKEVKGKDGRPERILELEKMLDIVAKSGGWQKHQSKVSYNVPDNVIADELIISLSAGVDPNVWVIQYDRQGMRAVKPISPSSPYWLYKFDTGAMSPGEMLELVRRDPYVISAEFNRQINAEPR